MIVLSTKKYQIEAIHLPGDSFQTWFLDRKINDGKYICLDCIASGTEREIRRMFSELVNGKQKTFSNF